MAINHTGYFDFAYAGLAARPSGRLVRFMAKDEVFRHRISGPLMRGMHHIPVDRDAGAASFRAAVAALKGGEIVGVFPEATISRSFELKEFKTGAVRMAAAAGVPLLPTVIWGSQRVWTKDHPKRLGRTRIPIVLSVGDARSRSAAGTTSSRCCTRCAAAMTDAAARRPGRLPAADRRRPGVPAGPARRHRADPGAGRAEAGRAPTRPDRVGPAAPGRPRPQPD